MLIMINDLWLNGWCSAADSKVTGLTPAVAAIFSLRQNTEMPVCCATSVYNKKLQGGLN